MHNRVLLPRFPMLNFLKEVKNFHEKTHSCLCYYLSGVKNLKKENEEMEWEGIQKSYPRFPFFSFSCKEDIDTNNDNAKHLERHSVRSFSDRPIAFSIIKRVFCVLTKENKNGGRLYPSAGRIYPINIYILSKNIDGLESGIYYVDMEKRGVSKMFDFDINLYEDLCKSAGVLNPSLFLILSSSFFSITRKYGLRGYRYSCIEVGAISSHLDLLFLKEGIGTVWLGGFDDREITDAIGVSWDQEMEAPLLLIAAGYELKNTNQK